ncbi:glycerophosphodiester phosphodiesterase [Oscillatoriales cyanobacterium LEGE 11467]|uniref:Glycerophosphodiester phosphodiesterase n=1 Tax=Zarconia navalis LEGE 11467 TaxID=1828826 RepID=A0A928VUL3_9CYAN|nr:glycerophosphodiester phosphodiesterase family protein [Zarconia navalis]MBE9040431.1 glycerophosphodiester phosphodiesterase [Zarconia navalis LEGE 11467]
MSDRNQTSELEIIAHRGYSAIAPENTLPAFARAIVAGADSIELDVQLSADGIPMVFHDITLERIAGIPDRLDDLTREQLARFDVGTWFDPQFSDARIPTLAEVLDILQSLKKSIYLDVKPHCTWSNEDIDRLLELLDDRGGLARYVICSFSSAFLDRTRFVSEAVKLGYSIKNNQTYPPQFARAVADGNSVTICEYRVFLENPALVAASRDRGVEPVVWTVDDLRDWHQLIDIGFRRIITNALLPTALDRKSIH